MWRSGLVKTSRWTDPECCWLLGNSIPCMLSCRPKCIRSRPRRPDAHRPDCICPPLGLHSRTDLCQRRTKAGGHRCRRTRSGKCCLRCPSRKCFRLWNRPCTLPCTPHCSHCSHCQQIRRRSRRTPGSVFRSPLRCRAQRSFPPAAAAEAAAAEACCGSRTSRSRSCRGVENRMCRRRRSGRSFPG